MTLQILATPGEHMQVLLSTVLPTKDFFLQYRIKSLGIEGEEKKERYT